MADNYLNSDLVLRAAWDPVNEGLKIIPATNTEFAIELSSLDGDSVLSVPNFSTVSTTTATDSKGMKSAVLYVEPGAAASVKLQVSPVDSASVWMDVPTSTVASDLTNVTASAVLSICARRVRVVVVSGSPVYHLVMQGV